MFAEMMASAHSRWTYVLPITHICVWLVSVSGHLLPKLDFLGILSTFLMFADFPISLAALALTWKHPDFAAMWILIVGTLWWYRLSRVAEFAIRRFTARCRGGLDKLSY
jgi:hypothetical protein